MSPRRARAVPGTGDPATELRRHLVDTTADLVASRSITSITTRDIARAAGVSDGVLYNYFGDKTDLLVAGLVRRFESLVADAVQDLPAAGTGTVAGNLRVQAAAFHGLGRAAFPMLAGLVTDATLLRRVMAEIHRPGQGILPFLNRIGEYLRAEQRLGRIADVDVDATLLLLTGASMMMLMGDHIRAVIGDQEAPLRVPSHDDTDLDRVLEVLLRCLV